MSRRTFMTNITPLPPSIPRDIAIACLHNHVEMIRLNPLVLRSERTTAPPNATLEEQVNCVWYEITDMMNYGVTKSELSYKGGFYNLDNGIQTRVFAPAGVDIKSTWKVKGSMPGEPPEPAELGVNVPNSGLYIREDIELRCNIFLMSFIKRNLRKPHTKLMQNVIVLAENTRQRRTQNEPRTSQSIRSPGESSIVEPYGLPVLSTSRTPPPGLARDTTHHRDEPCSCPGSTHHVMCPNYRYGAGSSSRRPESSQPAAQSYASRRSLAAGNAVYSPAGAHPDTTDINYQAFRPLQPRAQVARKLLPTGSSGSYSKIAYSSPQLFGEQVELPAVAAAPNRASSADGVVSELDGTEVAYWRQQQGAAELE
ncbi:hypothetical protein LTR08_003057 [Meristemomyces frigidus]|nr:hypothetical protein LTR08_003057 [Meristemomyces frigidus]